MGKFCKKCNRFLELDLFYKTKNTKTYIDGHIDWCKTCLLEYRKEKKEQKKIFEENPIRFRIEKKDLIISFD